MSHPSRAFSGPSHSTRPDLGDSSMSWNSRAELNCVIRQTRLGDVMGHSKIATEPQSRPATALILWPLENLWFKQCSYSLEYLFLFLWGVIFLVVGNDITPSDLILTVPNHMPSVVLPGGQQSYNGPSEPSLQSLAEWGKKKTLIVWPPSNYSGTTRSVA